MLQGKTLFITGASRGIGLAIALRAARDGANIVIAAKTTEPNPKLPGTIHSAAAEIERAGGAALPLQVDIRNEAAVQRAVELASTRFGGIDILVNNASAISLTGTLATPMKRFDLMFGVNVRGTYACSQACLPHLIASAAAGRNPHILTLAPRNRLPQRHNIILARQFLPQFRQAIEHAANALEVPQPAALSVRLPLEKFFRFITDDLKQEPALLVRVIVEGNYSFRLAGSVSASPFTVR